MANISTPCGFSTPYNTGIVFEVVLTVSSDS